MRASRAVVAGVGVAAVAAGWLLVGASAQVLPMAAVRESGEPVYPVYEGWYKNADGSFTFLFGYFNRNSKQTLEIPVGPNNRVEPGGADQGQPTHFDTKRGWGVFTVRVPKDFGAKKLTWTLSANGHAATVPAHLDPNWFIEPLEDAASKNRPPTLRFEQGGRAFEGPPQAGIAASFATSTAERLTFTVWATDVKPTTNVNRGGRGFERRERLDLSVHKFRGPGEVAFEKDKLEVTEGKATVAATFSAPGEYVLRVQANDESGEGGGGFQCCWTNAHVKVTVRPAVTTTGQ
jgi:hypothetical protein